jgi:cystathionine beta-lyase/cystathionine gamma-synthase
MERHHENAEALARYLKAHQRATRVHYSGLLSHPQHALAKRQMRGFGALILIKPGSLGGAYQFVNAVWLLSLGLRLVGVEMLINHPATITHGSVPVERRRQIGINGMVRFSVGIEDFVDIQEDVDQALASVT